MAMGNGAHTGVKTCQQHWGHLEPKGLYNFNVSQPWCLHPPPSTLNPPPSTLQHDAALRRRLCCLGSRGVGRGA
jgi:hypothetical protein